MSVSRLQNNLIKVVLIINIHYFAVYFKTEMKLFATRGLTVVWHERHADKEFECVPEFLHFMNY